MIEIISCVYIFSIKHHKKWQNRCTLLVCITRLQDSAATGFFCLKESFDGNAPGDPGDLGDLGDLGDPGDPGDSGDPGDPGEPQGEC